MRATTEKEINFFVMAAMIFAVCEVLSIELNNYFNQIHIGNYIFELNISVVFFCFSFFIIDLVTEIYDNKVANYFIYAKIVSQGLFIVFGNLAVSAAGISEGQIAESFSVAPWILMKSMVASVVGYKLTGYIMQYLKIKFNGKFLFSRYLSSTIPGEVMFSLVFSFLAFSKGRSIAQTLNVFVDLITIKFVVSFIFSLFVVPITTLIRHYLNMTNEQGLAAPMPFN